MRFWSLFLVLALAFLVPVGVLLWMADRAAKAEPLALKAQLTAAQAEQLDTVAQSIHSKVATLTFPTTLEEVAFNPYFGAFSTREAPFPLASEISQPRMVSEKASQLTDAIRNQEVSEIVQLTGISDLESNEKYDYTQLIYNEKGRNLTLDAWKFLVTLHPETWRAPVTLLLENLPLDSTTTGQTSSLARTVNSHYKSYLDNSLLLWDAQQSDALTEYCHQNNLAQFSVGDSQTVFINLNTYADYYHGLGEKQEIVLKLGHILANGETEIIHHFTTHGQPLTLATQVLENTNVANQRQRTFFLISLITTLFSIGAAWFIAYRIHQDHTLTRLKNSFLATATHELKTPLAASQSLLETLERGRLSDAEEKEYLAMLSRENQRLGRLVDQFLTFSRTERNAIRQEETSLTELLNPIKDWLLLHPDVSETDYELNFVDIDPNTVLFCDIVALETSLINLLDNAVKFTSNPRKIGFTVTQKGGFIHFSVSNNGEEISQKQQKAIFQPFYQVDQKLTRKHEGAGLGLSIVKSVTEAHDGNVSVESNSDITTFTISIPEAT